MYQLYFADRDATLYERVPRQNTGIDPILELTKIASGSLYDGAYQANTYNTRFLIDFIAQVNALSASIANGDIPPLGTNSTTPSAASSSVYLNIKAAYASDLPIQYTIAAYPVSQSWINGNGRSDDSPIQTNAASWYYPTGETSEGVGTYWNTASINQPGVTNIGGGSWITGSGFEASQTFTGTDTTPDIRMNVTDIMRQWVSGSISNNGFIVKRPYTNEISGDIMGVLRFFGRESNTVFVPRLEVAWNDVTLAGTGSFTEIASNTYVPYFKNIRAEYREGDKAVFRIGVRPEFPSKSFVTSSFYITDHRLPTSSYYSIKDTITNETLIPFDTNATQISCDSNGSFFKVSMDTFMPDRYYNIQLKIERDGGDDVQIHDDGFLFKVVK